jgi:hypothetical protein
MLNLFPWLYHAHCVASPSYSHSIFTVKLVRLPLHDTAHWANVSRMTIVDLAGSERTANTKATGRSNMPMLVLLVLVVVLVVLLAVVLVSAGMFTLVCCSSFRFDPPPRNEVPAVFLPSVALTLVFPLCCRQAASRGQQH